MVLARRDGTPDPYEPFSSDPAHGTTIAANLRRFTFGRRVVPIQGGTEIVLSRLTLAVALAATCIATTLTASGRSSTEPAHASVANGAIVVDGKPFFPVMLFDQCDSGAPKRAGSLGVNVILNATCAAAGKDQLRSLASAQLGVLPIGGRAVEGTRLLGWTYPDEPDNNGWSATGMATRFGYRRGNDDGHISFVTTTSRFFTGPDPKGATATAASFARVADVAGFDLYPVNHCSTSLRGVYDAQRRFGRLAAGTPTFQWIETGPIDSRYCGGVHLTPQEVTAEAWLAVAGGARGVGFFTHTTYPTTSEFAVTPAVQQAIRRFSGIAAAIRPGLTGTTVAGTSDTPPVIALARVAAGHTYVVAVNTLPSVVPAKLTVPRAAGHALNVVGENRKVAVFGGTFQDTFTPLGVHVYETS
jgi:hypothetical protein